MAIHQRQREEETARNCIFLFCWQERNIRIASSLKMTSTSSSYFNLYCCCWCVFSDRPEILFFARVDMKLVYFCSVVGEHAVSPCMPHSSSMINHHHISTM